MFRIRGIRVDFNLNLVLCASAIILVSANANAEMANTNTNPGKLEKCRLELAENPYCAGYVEGFEEGRKSSNFVPSNGWFIPGATSETLMNLPEYMKKLPDTRGIIVWDPDLAASMASNGEEQVLKNEGWAVWFPQNGYRVPLGSIDAESLAKHGITGDSALGNDN